MLYSKNRSSARAFIESPVMTVSQNITWYDNVLSCLVRFVTEYLLNTLSYCFNDNMMFFRLEESFWPSKSK